MKRSTDLILIRHAESTNNILSRKSASHEELIFDSDCDLSNYGFMQAKQLNSTIKVRGGYWPDLATEKWLVYCSPMLRCLRTATVALDGIDKQVFVNKHLHEAGGCFSKGVDGEIVGVSGRTTDEIKNIFPNVVCDTGMENGWYDRDHKETRDEFHARVSCITEWLWDNVTTTHQKQTQPYDGSPTNGIVLVAHGNVLSRILGDLLSIKERDVMDNLFLHLNTGVSHLTLHLLPNSLDDGTIYNQNNNNKLLTKSQTNLYYKKRVVIHYLNRTDHLRMTHEPISIGVESPDIADTTADTTSRAKDSRKDICEDSWIESFLDRTRKW